MHPTLEIFSQGEEIVTGQTVDTNAAWLSERAVQLGFTVTRHTAVGDKLDDLIVLLKEISLRADCCICTGGLGPTSDDLTTEAVAKAFDLPLEFDAAAFDKIRRYFLSRNRAMPEINRKQALLPKGSERIDNEWGTAPGFSLQAGRCRFVFLPGVPTEMKPMFLDKVMPSLNSLFTLTTKRLVTIKTLGLGESFIQQEIGKIKIPSEVQLGFRAGTDEVQTKLLFPPGYSGKAMASLTKNIVNLLGDRVFAVDGLKEEAGDLVAVVDKLMLAAGKTLAVVETASQGLLAAKCLGCAWLLGAVYEQSLECLGGRLAVEIDPDNLPKTGVKLANALKDQGAADFVLIQLFQGSLDRFQSNTQSIVLYNTLLTGSFLEQARYNMTGSGKQIQNQAALLTLDMVRRYLQNRNQ